MTIQSNKSDDEGLKVFGSYTIKPQTIIENHLVYINPEKGSHLVFSDYGWQVRKEHSMQLNYDYRRILQEIYIYSDLLILCIAFNG